MNFSIVTLNHDLGDKEPYPDVTARVWSEVGSARVMYVDSSDMTLRFVQRLLENGQYDVVYLNSFFSPRFSIIPMLAHRFSRTTSTLLMAPRGEFSSGALELKSFKKRMFISIGKLVGLFKGVKFHASTIMEAEDIWRAIGSEYKVEIAKDLPDLSVPEIPKIVNSCENRKSILKVCFISRIVPKKNLDYAIKVLKQCQGEIEFSIYGSKEDEDYWKLCEGLLSELPDNISSSYCGTLHPSMVKKALLSYDTFLFPTRGENFGHVIAEALLSGVFPLISDQTPWRQVEELNIGRTIRLTNMQGFVEELERFCSLSVSERYNIKLDVQKKALPLVINEEDVKANKRLFKIN